MSISFKQNTELQESPELLKKILAEKEFTWTYVLVHSFNRRMEKQLIHWATVKKILVAEKTTSVRNSSRIVQDITADTEGLYDLHC